MEMVEILKSAMAQSSSDVIIIPGAPPAIKVNGDVIPLSGNCLRPEDTMKLMEQVYAYDRRSDQKVLEMGDDDFSFSISGVGRFRCNAYKQRNSMAMVLRVISFELPDAEKMQIPNSVMRLADVRKGLVLVTGPAGSGKSTTLACLINRINENYHNHIITIEDPIEFIHPHKNSVVSQREIEHDTQDYATALRAVLRQAPDVILLGEMRDFTTIQTALTAAETGQLVFSTLHTIGAAKTVDRIIDVFPAKQQQQIRIQLSMALQAVISQQLVPTLDGGRAPAFEIMLANSAIQNMIREGKAYQMDNVIFSSADQGMQSMDASLMRLCTEGRISRENAVLYAVNPDLMRRHLTES